MNAPIQTQGKASVTLVPASNSHLLQRKCACGGSARVTGECEQCSKSNLSIQRSTAEPGTPNSEVVPPIVHEVLSSSGQPIDRETRAFFEPRFGHDFSHVRVHLDARAAESARAVNALAYTVGPNVVFGAGQFNPQTKEGKSLLAHELTHVVQQSAAVGSLSPKGISTSDEASEREAEHASEALISGQSLFPVSPTDPMVSRQGGAPTTLSGLTARRVAFNNTGAPDANNCAASKPAALGVDGPSLGENGMEMIFRIDGAIPSGTEFDITRTKATGVWQQDAGVWTRLGGWPAGTSDDHHDDDECLTPVGRRIFALDTPGNPGSLDGTGVYPGAGTVVASATAAVWKLSFAEWVIARNRSLGIDWTAISTPLFHRWHSILSVSKVGGVWTRVDTPSGQHNEIELGNITTTGATP